jgi:hypothetical protein
MSLTNRFASIFVVSVFSLAACGGGDDDDGDDAVEGEHYKFVADTLVVPAASGSRYNCVALL